MPQATAQPVRWNAANYAANSTVQQIWARELMARLHLRGDEHVLDVGCGDGKITAEIARAVPRGRVTGVDASEEMIFFARKTFPPKKSPNLKFHVRDARKIGITRLLAPSSQREAARGAEAKILSKPRRPASTVLPLGWGTEEKDASFDLVFSNAALHWVDDHQAILRGAASVLKPGGRLVISCGGKGNAQDVFVALRPEMRLKRWRSFFRRMPQPYFFYAPADYEKWLPKFGFKINSLKLAPKDAVYGGPFGFSTWLRTTWIPYVQRVPEDFREEFISAVTRRYLARHPLDDAGAAHVRMVRLEIDAVKV